MPLRASRVGEPVRSVWGCARHRRPRPGRDGGGCAGWGAANGDSAGPAPRARPYGAVPAARRCVGGYDAAWAGRKEPAGYG
ncbi:hypothetical protein KPATCC21470_1392 [Kitasatospora purpeofusca]